MNESSAPSAAEARRADERLTELEIKSAFAEDLLEELNRSVYRQQRLIEQLQLELQALRRQVQASLPAASGEAEDEKPPHY